MREVIIPFRPRKYQIALNQFILDGGKRAYVSWHRRAGKDLDMWNLMIRKASGKSGLYYYFLPTYTQGKKIIWEGVTNDGMRFLDFIPKEMREGDPNSSEMKIKLKNGSMIQIIGTDNYDSIRGTNPIGCVFSEFAYQNPMAWEVVKPILTVNGGWALFNTTPNGKNHAYEMYEMAKDNPQWFCQILTITDTGVLTEEDMVRERAEGMSEEMIQQEYYCSFDIGALGAYYARQVQEMVATNRITSVPHEKGHEVILAMDLGRDDATSIGFVQRIGKEIRFIDFYENHGQDIAHYAEILKEMPYKYGALYLPHDAFAKRLESSKTIAEQFEGYGFTVKRVAKLEIASGIQLVRKLFPNFWIDKENCKQLIKAMENYHQEWDPEKKVFKQQPLHDWSSHSMDMLRYMCTVLDAFSTDMTQYREAHDTYLRKTLIEQKRSSLEKLDDGMNDYRRSQQRYLESIK